MQDGTFQFRTVIQSDREVFDILLQIILEKAMPVRSIWAMHYMKPGRQEFLAKDLEEGATSFDTLLGPKFEIGPNQSTKFFKKFQFNVLQDAIIAFDRSGDELVPLCSLVAKPNIQQDIETLTSILPLVHERLGALDIPTTDHKALEESAATILKMGADNLTKLEEMHRRLHIAITETETQRIEVDREREKEREARYDNREAKLAAEIDEEKKKLEDLRRNLDAEKERLKTQESKHIRRELREEMQKTLKQRTESFELTPETKEQRQLVHTAINVALLVAVCVFAATTGYPALAIFFSDSTSLSDIHTTPWGILAIVKSVLSGIGLAALVYYKVHWESSWLNRYANEEFRHKRLALDIDRASWVYEAALEWRTETENENMPDKLIERLSSDLFFNERTRESDIHPADQLASAILGSAAEATIRVGDNEVKLTKQGLKQLAKIVQENDSKD